jgi:hypothetical protein
MKKLKQNQPKEPPWIKLRAEMLNSPAWRALTPAAMRVILRLIIEHTDHAGKDNGHLICTYQDFAEYGIRYQSIGPAIRQAVALGFVEITQIGWRSSGQRRPAKYRLTFLPTANAGPTDEWKTISRCENAPTTGCENAPRRYGNRVRKRTPSVIKNRVRKRTYYLDAIHTSAVAAAVGQGSAAAPAAPAHGTDSQPAANATRVVNFPHREDQ